MSKQKLNHYVEAFTKHQIEMKMFHFQTKYYGAHKASDAYLAKFMLNFDRFMEAAQGEFGQISSSKVQLNFPTLTDKTVKGAIDRFIKFLDKVEKDFDIPDLLTIRDEMLADAKQLKYLLIFK